MGTGAVGRMFGPVMAVWFTVIGLLGVRGIVAHPVILEALSPSYAIGFLAGHFGTAFFSLTAVVLAVTGAEALYADMGHFGRTPVRRAWLLVVFPACILNYLGQGALILGHPASISNPFFLLAPGWARLPMVFLATVATVIASQAVISGAFSVAHQAGRLGYLPRLRIQYTSEQMMGQIYVPWINWLLLVAVLTLVLAFRTSAALAYAYGTAVTGTITITTLLFFYYARHQWRWPLWIVLAGGGALIVIDLLFFAANLTKVTHGAWLPLLIGLIAFAAFTTWQRGRELVTVRRIRAEGPLTEFMEQLHAMKPPLHRVPGTAVFLNRGKATAPLAMRANVEHNEILHEHVVILSVETMPVPHVPAEERLQIDDLGYEADRIIHVTACLGLGPVAAATHGGITIELLRDLLDKDSARPAGSRPPAARERRNPAPARGRGPRSSTRSRRTRSNRNARSATAAGSGAVGPGRAAGRGCAGRPGPRRRPRRRPAGGYSAGRASPSARRWCRQHTDGASGLEGAAVPPVRVAARG